MSAGPALALAVDLLRRPDLARSMRSAPLPTDVDLLMRVVAGEETPDPPHLPKLSGAAKREAAEFYLQQILLHPENDAYRVLGGSSQTPIEVLRRHRTLLLKWLHPDRQHDEWEAVFAARVNAAWAYVSCAAKGQGTPQMNAVVSSLRSGSVRGGLPWIARPIAQAHSRPAKSKRKVANLRVAGILVALSAICLPALHVPAKICASLGWICWGAEAPGGAPLEASSLPSTYGRTEPDGAEGAGWRSSFVP